MKDTFAPSFVREDERGVFKELLNGQTWTAVNWASMKKGSIIGNHYHKNTQMAVFLVHGEADIVIEDIRTNEKRSFTLNAQEGVFFHPEESHAMTFTKDSEFIMLKDRFDPKNPDIFEHKVV